jgi:FtsP/CotA-like multicopper oxidase with cupredoxin domain
MVNMHRHAGASHALLLLAFVAAVACGRSSSRGARSSRERLSSLPAVTCTLDGTVRSCELWARAGTLTLPGGAAVPIWGYAATAEGAPTVPGPVLVALEGETLSITLHDDLAAPTGLLLRGQAMPPDLEGVAAGASRTYTVTASAPGTFLYEAAPLPGAEHQVPMGLYGALVVRPAAAAATQAYADAATAYDDEALVLLSEVDPALNGSADPAAFDLRAFAPRFRLLNGKAFPETAPIPTGAGSRVLLRYVNAGLIHHSMAILGTHQLVIAADGAPRAHPARLVAETIGPGQTLDAIVTVPAATPAGGRLALHDASLLLHNDGGEGVGGMLTFLVAGTAAGGGDIAGPATTGVAVAPASTGGAEPVTLTATVTDAATGGAAVTAAEWFADAVGAAGSGAPLSGAFGAPAVAVSATLDPAALAPLSSGDHLLYVRGRDALGNWGPVNFAVLTIDRSGPATTAPQLSPALSRGAAPIAVSATADDRATGGSDIQGAEWFVDVAGAPGTGGALAPNAAAPIASVDGTIPVLTLAGLAEGTHQVWIRSQDALGAWGAAVSVPFTVDRTGPVASAPTVAPSPTDGTAGVNSTVAAVRVTVVLTDALSSVAGGEGFVDALGAPGAGFPLVARRAVFDGSPRTGYADVPLSTVAQLAEGAHPIWLRGRDAAGNWGAAVSAPLVVDRLPPVVSGVAAAPNPTNGPGGANTSFTLTASATDATTQVVGAEWFDGADPGVGAGIAFPVTAAPTVSLATVVNFVARGWTAGNHAVSVRARDAAGHWSAPAAVVVSVVLPNTLPDAIFADGFEGGNTSAWSGGAAGAGLAVNAGAALVGGLGLAADLGAGASFVTDLTPAAERTYHARFWLDPNGAVTSATVPVDVLTALDAASAPVLRVQYLHPVGGALQVRLLATRAGGTTASRYFAITDAPHAVELAWASGTTGAVSLYTDGVLRQTLALDTSAGQVDAVRLGPAAGLGGASGTIFLDAFASTRTTVIGP